jgi:hypothetical protein
VSCIVGLSGRCRVVQLVVLLAKGLHGSHEAVLCCKERVGRVGARAISLVPALQELRRVLSPPMKGVELPVVQALSEALVQFAKVRRLLCEVWRWHWWRGCTGAGLCWRPLLRAAVCQSSSRQQRRGAGSCSSP